MTQERHGLEREVIGELTIQEQCVCVVLVQLRLLGLAKRHVGSSCGKTSVNFRSSKKKKQKTNEKRDEEEKRIDKI